MKLITTYKGAVTSRVEIDSIENLENGDIVKLTIKEQKSPEFKGAYRVQERVEASLYSVKSLKEAKERNLGKAVKMAKLDPSVSFEDWCEDYLDQDPALMSQEQRSENFNFYLSESK